MYSKYNIYLRDFPRNSFLTIYNLFSQKAICIQNNVFELGVDRTLENKLKSIGMIVEDCDLEYRNVLKYYNEVSNSKDELNIMLLLTQRCNCKCIYCYEEGSIMDGTDLENIDDIYYFLLEYVKEYGYKKINIVFYGGEPLLNKKKIDILSEKLFKKYGNNYCFDIVTNGTLIELNDILLWKEYGLRRVKITVDGDEESHNCRRPLKNGANAYQIILDKMERISSIVDVLINVVVDETFYGIESMVDEFLDKNIKAKFSISIREPDVYDYNVKTRIIMHYSKILADKGVYQFSKMGGNHGVICAGKRQNSFVIDTRRNVYYCNGNFNYKMPLSIKNMLKQEYIITDNCKNCKYLPICYGECRFNPKCQKEYYDIVVDELLKTYLKEKKNIY